MKVKCASYSYERNEWAEYDIASSLKVYPCCGYHGYYELNPWDVDNFAHLPSDWNDLKVHSMETIKETMHSVLNTDNFNSGNCPARCKLICGIEQEERHTPVRTK